MRWFIIIRGDVYRESKTYDIHIRMCFFHHHHSGCWEDLVMRTTLSTINTILVVVHARSSTTVLSIESWWCIVGFVLPVCHVPLPFYSLTSAHHRLKKQLTSSHNGNVRWSGRWAYQKGVVRRAHCDKQYYYVVGGAVPTTIRNSA